MQKPLQVVFKQLPHSEALEERIQREVARLEEISPNLVACRVVVEAPHRHGHQGRLYQIKIELSVPGKELQVSRDQHDKHAHEDAYVAVRDAFAAMQRQLISYNQKRQFL